MHVDEERFVARAQHAVGHVQEPGAARAAEELAARGGQQVAADLLDVDDELADRLAGVDQVEEVELAAEAADLGDGGDEPRVGGDVGDGDEPGAVGPHQRGHRVDVDHAVRPVGRVHDAHAEPLAQGEEGDLVGDEVVAGREDDVVGLERDRGQGRGVGVGGAARERDVVGGGVDEGGDLRVEAADLGGPGGRRLVAADLGLEVQVVDHHRRHGPRHQAAAGVVEVDDPVGPRCVGAQGGDVELKCFSR